MFKISTISFRNATNLFVIRKHSQAMIQNLLAEHNERPLEAFARANAEKVHLSIIFGANSL